MPSFKITPLLAMLFLLLSSMASAQESVRILADEWYPMNGQPDSEKPGYMIELAKAIFEPQSITVNYRITPWERAVQRTRVGANDCVVGAYKEDTPDFIFPDEHWGIDIVHLYKLKSDPWRYDGKLSSFANRSVGIIKGYRYGDAFDEYAEKHAGTLFEYVSGEDGLDKNIRKLLSLRIDTLVESRLVMEAKIKESSDFNSVVSAGPLTTGFPMYIACSPATVNGKRFINLVNTFMPKIKSDGTLANILARYGISEW